MLLSTLAFAAVLLVTWYIVDAACERIEQRRDAEWREQLRKERK